MRRSWRGGRSHDEALRITRGERADLLDVGAMSDTRDGGMVGADGTRVSQAYELVGLGMRRMLVRRVRAERTTREYHTSAQPELTSRSYDPSVRPERTSWCGTVILTYVRVVMRSARCSHTTRVSGARVVQASVSIVCYQAIYSSPQEVFDML